jgi:hypothetical protein
MRIEVADFGAGDAVRRALGTHGINASALTLASSSTDGTANLIILAFGRAAPVSQGIADCDWAKAIQSPLDSAFAVLRHHGPKVRDLGGQILAVLPVETLDTAGGGGAAAVLHRSVLGLMEGLRAELLGGDARASILFADPVESASSLGGRLIGIAASRAMYSVPQGFDAEAIDSSFRPLLTALATTPIDPRLPPAGPMGEVYRAALAD